MKWIVDKLTESNEVTFRPRGNSMHPLVKNGQEVTVRRYDGEQLALGTVVLCKVSGKIYLHKVTGFRHIGTAKAADGSDMSVFKYQISNNKGHVNGWTSTIYGVMINA